MRLNLILFFTLIIFSLATVNSEHQYTKQHRDMSVENKKTLELRDEKTKLQLEESDKSGNERIEQIAKKKLRMHNPSDKEKVFLGK